MNRVRQVVDNLNVGERIHPDDVMQDLLENVVTDRIEATFNKYLPAVLKNDVKAETKSENVLTESKEVTGNKTETANADDEGNIIEIKRLAGLN